MKKYIVYLIRHISTGTVLYVGKTDNFKRRAYQHLSLKTNSKEWLSSIGTSNVLIEEVAKFDNEVDALKYEDELIIKYNTITNGYNVRRSGLIKVENQEKYHRDYYREYYQKNDIYKEYQQNYQKEYHKTDKYRDYQKEYQKTEKYKEKRREKRKTEEYREYERAYKRDYYQAKKLGIKIDEYRKFEQNKKQPIQLTINF